ncbi:MAG: ABC transporter ATP-binding protein/permease [Anaerolineales bacterium]|nr:ABC transporter ATP-binding protein/permease [Anaerolineales bacterium]
MLLLGGITAINLVVPGIIRQVIDRGLALGDAAYLIRMSLLLLVIGLVRAVLPYGLRYTSEWVAAHLGYDLRNRLFNHIQYLPFAYHDHAQAGQLISRTIEDVRAIERFLGIGFVELVRVVLLLVGVTTVIITENAYLAAIALLPMIPMVLLTTNFGRRIGKLFLNVDQTLGEISTRLQENVSGAQVVRAFARELYEKQRFEQANQEHYDARLRVLSEFSRVMPTTHLLVNAGIILILFFGGQLVLQGELTIGELVAFNSYVLMLSGPAQQLTWMVNSAGEARAAAERTFEILDKVPAIRSAEGALKLGQLSGRVSFEAVNFHYDQGGAAALQDINLQVPPNQVVALIGPTGSGKTSLVNLIPRFYDATSGAVRVDDVDVRQVDLVTLRKQIGIVLQTSLLFSASVRDNIAYGRPEATLEEVIEAAKAAQAHEFILELSQGYDTVVGERGITLSGGQRQRMAIARALLMDPRILILDDSTSSVDMQTERLIQKALDRLMEGRTTFVIAHRLSTVRRADLILVMDGGRIVEKGKHHDLLALDGLYREIYDLQLRDQERFRDEMEALQEAELLPAGPSSRGMEG